MRFCRGALEAARADEEPLELTRSHWGDALIEFIDEEPLERRGATRGY